MNARLLKINIHDERFSKFLDEVRNSLEHSREEDVFFFDHSDGVMEPLNILSRTAIIACGMDQFLIIQSYFVNGEEHEPSIIRLPMAAIKFMCADIMDRNVYATAFKILGTEIVEMKFKGWVVKEGVVSDSG